MKINIITAFPEFFDGAICSLLKKAVNKGILSFNVIDLKLYGTGKHKKIDDTPYGGGAGMILRADVIENVLESNFDVNVFRNSETHAMFLPSPRGRLLNQRYAFDIAKYKEIVILCNRYEGIDQRAIEYYPFHEISIGSYILMGGETAAMCIVESSCRLIDGVIGKVESYQEESFSDEDFIEYDHYTKPSVWNDLSVPDVLKSGNHGLIKKWRYKAKI